MPYQLTVRDHFSAAHNLRAYRGKCEHLHGHNWNVDLLLEGADLDEEGMLMDFAEVKQVLAGVLDRFDHRYLNEVPPFDRLNPSCENLARVIAEEVAARLPAGVRLAALTAWESERCSITYRPPVPASPGGGGTGFQPVNHRQAARGGSPRRVAPSDPPRRDAHATSSASPGRSPAKDP